MYLVEYGVTHLLSCPNCYTTFVEQDPDCTSANAFVCTLCGCKFEAEHIKV